MINNDWDIVLSSVWNSTGFKKFMEMIKSKYEESTCFPKYDDIFNALNEKLVEKLENAYETLRYLNFYLNRMEQVPELKYILAYMAKSNGFIKPLEFIYDEDRKRLIGERSNKVYKIGDKVRIRVISANKLLRQIDFEIIENK